MLNRSGEWDCELSRGGYGRIALTWNYAYFVVIKWLYPTNFTSGCAKTAGGRGTKARLIAESNGEEGCCEILMGRS
jgi:hypothetical protein